MTALNSVINVLGLTLPRISGLFSLIRRHQRAQQLDALLGALLVGAARVTRTCAALRAIAERLTAEAAAAPETAEPKRSAA